MRRALSAVLLAGFLSSCTTLEPAYRRPASPVPASFPQGAAYAPDGSNASTAADLAWNSVLLDPRLQSVVGQALANNRDLRIAASNAAQARALYRGQRSAQFPYVDLGGSAGVNRGPGLNGDAVTTESYSVDVGATAFEIDLFGRLRSLTNAALLEYFASEEGARATRIALIGETANVWLTLAADRERLRIARATAQLAQQSVDLNRRRLEGGIASQLELSQAETILQQAHSDAAALTTQVAQDRNALELLVGAPVADAQLPASLEPGFVLAGLPGGIGSAVLLRRPDVLQAENRLRAANANIGAARAAFFPSLSLTGAAGLASTALSGLFDGGVFAASAGLGAGLPLFDAGRNRANLELSQAQRSAAVAQYERTVQVAFREVADALARQGTIDEQVTAARALVAAAQTSVEISEARYREGAGNFLAVLEAQRTLYGAQQSLTAIELARESSVVNLYRALGGGLLD